MIDGSGRQPGIFLEADLLGDGEWEDDQDSDDTDGEAALQVPVGGGSLVCHRRHH